MSSFQKHSKLEKLCQQSETQLTVQWWLVTEAAGCDQL